MSAKELRGRRGEEPAAGYLEAQDKRIVDGQWRCTEGDIDFVALNGDTLVIAEVKTQKSPACGHPIETVNVKKLARLLRLGSASCRAYETRGRLRRVGGIAVLDDGPGDPAVEHLKEVG